MEEVLFGRESPEWGVEPGLLEQAHGGVIYFDEVADMPLGTQPKILRVLTEQTFERVGGAKKVKVDVRIISSTAQNLESLMSEGAFREDLYHRLAVVPISVPPLAERRADIPLLIDAFMRQISDQTGIRPKELSPEALAVLQSSDWPGNIRELANALAYAGAVADSGEIGLDDLPPSLVQAAAPCDAPCSAPEDEAQRLYATLTDTGWNISAASRRLGVDRTTMHRRMRRLGVTRPH